VQQVRERAAQARAAAPVVPAPPSAPDLALPQA
jgi:hypothetical protein